MAIVNLIKSFYERPAQAKETPYTPLYKKIKIKFVRYRKVLVPPQRREKEKYISYNVSTYTNCFRKSNLLLYILRIYIEL